MTELTHESTSRTLETERGPLHYHEAGDGPPLVLLHGSGPGVSGWANFGGNLPTFAEHFRTLVLDLPGFGKSYSPDEPPVMAAPQATIDFLDGLSLSSVAVVGNSMGGNVAARVAASHPDRVHRLVAIGGIGLPLFTPSPPEGIKLLVEFVEDPTRARLLAWMQSMVHDPSVLTDDVVEMRWEAATDPAAHADLAKMFNRRTLAAMADPAATAAAQLGMMTKIAAPTLVTFGRDDRVTPLDQALVPMRYIARCEVHVFYDCGHWAMIERKAEFESVVLSFLIRDL